MKLRTLIEEVSGAVGSGSESCSLLLTDLDKRLADDLGRSKLAGQRALSAIDGFRSAVQRTLDEAEQHVVAHLREAETALSDAAAFYKSELTRVRETLDQVRGEHLDGGANASAEAPRPVPDFSGAVAAELEEAATAPPEAVEIAIPVERTRKGRL